MPPILSLLEIKPTCFNFGKNFLPHAIQKASGRIDAAEFIAPVINGFEDEISVDEAATVEGRNRYIVEGLPLKTYDCSQITDGYAGMIVATEDVVRQILRIREDGGSLCPGGESAEGCTPIGEIVTNEIFPPPAYQSNVFTIVAEAQVGDVVRSIEVVVDRFRIRPDLQLRLSESFETALRIADGTARIAYMDDPDEEELIFSDRFACNVCGYSLTELEPRLFSFNNPVPTAVIKKRCERMRRIGEQKRLAFYHRHVGEQVTILVEATRDKVDGRLKGLTGNYIPVRIDGPDTLINTFQQVVVTRISEDGLPEGCVQS